MIITNMQTLTYIYDLLSILPVYLHVHTSTMLTMYLIP